MKNLVSIVLLALSSNLGAQEVVDLDASPACASCRPAVVLKQQIEFSGAAASPDYDASVTGAPSGTWLFASRTFGGEIAAFDSANGLQFIGRDGQGPREFRGAITVRSRGDHYYAHDFGNNRFTRVNEDLSLGDQAPAGGVIRDWRVTRDGSIVAVGFFEAEGTHYRMMVLGPDMESRRYGLAATPADFEDPSVLTPLLSLDGRGNAVIASRFGGGIVEVDLSTLSVTWSGELKLEGLVREPVQVRWNEEPPPTQFVGVSHDELGNLWVFASVADDEWQPGARETGTSPHEVFDSKIFVLDRRDRRMITSGRKNLLIPGGDRGYVSIYMDDVDAIGTFSLWLDRN